MKRLTFCVAILTAAFRAIAQVPEPLPADRLEEVIVVTASRTEQRLADAPAAMTVITAADLERMSGNGYAEILRLAPGLNVTQMNAREIQVSTRAATSSLATGQLVLLDGRTLHLDFLGFVMWDFVPVDTSEIRQIEVVRGPGSAVWGANAENGVINLITKTPAEMAGTSIVFGAGELQTLFGNAIHAGMLGEGSAALSYKISAGFHAQAAFARPSGSIAGTQTPYPPFENEGTRQSRLDLRADRDVCIASGRCASISLSGGYAATDGLVHTGIGPFDLRRGAAMTYAKADLATAGGLHASAFANLLEADSTNLLAIGVDGRPISFAFDTDTFGVEVTDHAWIGQKHHLTYGVSARRNEFDLSIAPPRHARAELGAFVQEDLPLGRARWVIGTRVDRRDPIGTVVSPRAALLFSPADGHAFRLSFARAFRAPSAINNALDTAIVSLLPLPSGPYAFVTRAVGDPRLREERLDAWEVGYTSSPGANATWSVSAYQNRSRDVIDFYPAAFYDSASPPAGWPLPAWLLDVAPFHRALPALFSYRNAGEITNRGIELALSGRRSPRWSWLANYSWQDAPVARGIPADEINIPPAHRANATLSWNGSVFFASAMSSYQSEAIWRDVLDARYWGPTPAFLSWNANAGVRLSKQVSITVAGTNLTNRKIQQHVFGDIIGRRVTAQVRVHPDPSRNQ